MEKKDKGATYGNSESVAHQKSFELFAKRDIAVCQL